MAAMIILPGFSVFLPSLAAAPFLCQGAQHEGSRSGKQRWDAGGDSEHFPKGVPCLSCPVSPLAGQFWGDLRGFYPFYCINMLYVTSPIINVSYSRIWVERVKSLPLSKVTGRARAPICCLKSPLLPFPFLLPNKPLPGAAESWD